MKDISRFGDEQKQNGGNSSDSIAEEMATCRWVCNPKELEAVSAAEEGRKRRN